MCEVIYENKGKGRVCIYAKEVAHQRRKKGREDEGIVIESDIAKGMQYGDILKKDKVRTSGQKDIGKHKGGSENCQGERNNNHKTRRSNQPEESG